jgi:hypothetical protein
MAIHPENFLVVRSLLPRITDRWRSRTEVAAPASAAEHDYRDLLAEANLNFFHREYAIALDNYLALRNRILVQSHPELPATPGTWHVWDIPLADLQWDRFAELSRRVLVRPKPGDPIELKLTDTRLIQPGEFEPNPALAPLRGVGLDVALASITDTALARERAREVLLEGDGDRAARIYETAQKAALAAGDARLAAEISAEHGTMAATYARDAARPAALRSAGAAFNEALRIYAELGDADGQTAMRSNLSVLATEEHRPPIERDRPRGRDEAPAGERAARFLARRLEPQTLAAFQYLDAGNLRTARATIGAARFVEPAERSAGFFRDSGALSLSLDRASFTTKLAESFYTPRILSQDLDGLRFHEEVETNFVAYIPHLFFFVLPMAIADTYVELGRYTKALEGYQSILTYPYLNRFIETPALWQRMAKVCLRHGSELFRREDVNGARVQYERIINTDLSIPTASPLYQGAVMQAMQSAVTEAVKEIQGQPHAPVNPRVLALVGEAHVQLQKIANGLNFLGLGTDDYPVFRFKYLQAAANYLADNAVQSERTFLSFRASAEQQKLDRIQMENAVDVAQEAYRMEEKRLQDSALEWTAATQSRQYAELRSQHAQATLNDWNTLGWELATVNAALSWASNASNDQDIRYTGVQYDGRSHDFSTDVEDFYDTVGEWRENLNFEIQQRRLERQQAEAAAEVAITKTREQQALVRFEIQKIAVQLAQKRFEGAQEMLDYSQDRMLDEDLWFQLAGELRDLAQRYLDMAIYAAFLMERAYDLEFDRRLNVIRLDYGLGGVQGLLGGDYLKRDIASFTLDYLQNAQKKNPVRAVISLRDEFPAAFATFVKEGILPFRTDLEIFDRRFPGTYRRKLKKVEIFVEGLVPLDGVAGTLLHQGVSTEWRQAGGSWTKHTRVLPPDRLVLSSYEFRRDVTVFRPSEELLDQFENLGPQGNWRLELPRSANNLDYEAVSDIKLALYFDADMSDTLRAHVKALYPADGGRSLILSSRFHYPDQYFRLDADRKVDFALPQARFAYHYTDQRLQGLAVRVVPKPAAAASGLSVTITRKSDGTSVTAATNTDGFIQGAPATMAPFAAWKDASPVDTFTVGFAADVDTSSIADVELAIDYRFAYRPDGTVAA